MVAKHRSGLHQVLLYLIKQLPSNAATWPNRTIFLNSGLLFAVHARSVEAYDIRQDTWQIIASMNIRRSTLGAAMLSGLIYAVGGFDGSVGLDSVERYNPGRTRGLSSIVPAIAAVLVVVVVRCPCFKSVFLLLLLLLFLWSSLPSSPLLLVLPPLLLVPGLILQLLCVNACSSHSTYELMLSSLAYSMLLSGAGERPGKNFTKHSIAMYTW